MKRDMELMRKIMFAIEEEYDAGKGGIYDLQISGYEMAVVAEHCKLLYQQGMINNYDPHYADNKIYGYAISNLSSLGYDYLELIRNDKVWTETTKEIAEKKLPRTIETIGTVAASIVGAFMREYNR